MAAKGTGTWLKVASKGGGSKSVFVSNKLGGRAFNQGETITQSELNAHLSQASKILEKQGVDAKAKFPGTFKQASASAKASGEPSTAKSERSFEQLASDYKAATAKLNEGLARLDKRANAIKKKYGSESTATPTPKASPRLPKAALSKQEKTQILLKNKKRLMSQYAKYEANDAQIKRLNRIEKADRQRRKAENPNAPSFARAAKAAETKRKKGGGSSEGDRKNLNSVARKARIEEIKSGIMARVNDKTKTPGQRYPDMRKANYLERNKTANDNANLVWNRGKGSKAKRRANALKGKNNR